ncbi:MAG TPA: 4-alpha-glucanotransferase [Gemmatimonadaceae bacterium]|nr:4-alpha-glucanotransferase [Gemmatimonadaceae bacterium]
MSTASAPRDVPALASPALRALCDRAGILPSYMDTEGRTRELCASSAVALLAVLGLDASDEDAAARTVAALDAAAAARLLEPVRVATAAVHARSRLELRVPPEAVGSDVTWSLALHTEQGDVLHREGRARVDGSVVRAPLPAVPPLGYHRLEIVARLDGAEQRAEQALIVVPERCVSPAEVLGARTAFGVTASLFSVRRERDWGVGDCTTLGALAAWTGARGGDFVGVNPLHATRNSGMDISPYSPVSRLYRNPIYIDVEAVPEMPACDEARALLATAHVQETLHRARASDAVLYDLVFALKMPVLRALHRTFRALHHQRDSERERAYLAYCRAQGAPLDEFARFMATLDPAPSERRAGEDARDDEDFHRWLQFELDRQLAVAAARGRDAGLAIGIYQDLAIGSAPGGSDVASFPDIFVRGATLGAPPDAYAAEGQNWGLPPLHPARLRESGYRYWRLLLRATLAHSGALRVDHILGLFRQFWIPDGAPAREGAYIRFPTEDLLGILALESVRHGAIIVGEDLGTVPPEVHGTLARWQILSSRVLPFERTEDGGYRDAASYEPRALASATTHDHPTLRAFWRGTDLPLRRALELIPDDDALRRAEAERAADRKRLIERLQTEGLLAPGVTPDESELCAAVHAFLCRTPSALVALSLDDLVGEERPVNVPGVSADRFPSWTRRLAVPVEALSSDPHVARALRCARGRR